MLRRSGAAVVALLACASCTHELAEAPPSLASIAPTAVCTTTQPTTLTLTGANFTPLPMRTLAGGEALMLPVVTLHGPADLAPPVRWQSEQQLSVALAPPLQSGLYDVTVGNPDGRTATLPHALGVSAPPSVSSMPAQICDTQADQTITVSGTGFLVLDGQQPSVSIYDTNGALTLTATATTSNCGPLATGSGDTAMACTVLSFTVPKSALTPGSYSLRVTNPGPLACQSLEMITLTVMRGKC